MTEPTDASNTSAIDHPRPHPLFGLLFVVPAAVCCGLSFLLPLLRTCMLRLQNASFLGPAEFIGMQNYANLFTDEMTGQACVFTLIRLAVVTGRSAH